MASVQHERRTRIKNIKRLGSRIFNFDKKMNTTMVYFDSMTFVIKET